jgi:hypothetical protein
VAALLVIEELLPSMVPLVELNKKQTWGVLRQASEFGRNTAWEENRGTLGHALTPDGYMTLATTYSGLVGGARRAASEPPDAQIATTQGTALATTFLALNRGLTYLNALIHRPPVWKPRARRTFAKERRERVADLLRKDTARTRRS